MRSNRLLLAPLFALSLSALATTAHAQASTSASERATTAAGIEKPQAKKARPRSSEPITAAEIAESTKTDVLEAVRALRPSWLRTRGQSSFSRAEYVKVYQDGMLMGPLSALRSVPINAVAAISYLDGASATQRFGTDHGSGAIMVSTRK